MAFQIKNILIINEDVEETKIIKTKSIVIKPMAPEEAVLQMEMLGHDFFVFTDAGDGLTKVVYKRKDGDYGMLEPAAK